jgi:sporulation integral membrane protein YlbJ
MFREQKWGTLTLGALTLLALVGLLCYPQEGVAAAKDALALCANVLIPSLFPFFVLSSLAVGLGLAAVPGRLLQKLMAPLFRVNGNCAAALVLGLIGGYPVGARTTAQLYRNGLCSRTEAQRLLAFCNNCGPAFLLGAVGTGVFGDLRIGLLLGAVHLISALLVGLLFRFYHPGEGASPLRQKKEPSKSRSGAAVLTEAVSSSCTAALQVCGYVVLFAVLLRLITRSGLLGLLARGLAQLCAPLGLSFPWSKRLLAGALELTNGIAALPAGDEAGGIPMAAFLLGWGGVSVHCQTLSVLEGTDLSLGTCLIGKLLQGCCSALLAVLAVRWLGIAPVFLASANAATVSHGASGWAAALALALGLLMGAALALGRQSWGSKKPKERL